MKLINHLLITAICASGAYASNLPSAKRAIELANTQITTGADNKVIRLEGKDADSDLKPRQWDVTVYDPTRANKASSIRIKDGVVVSIAPAVRMFDDARWGHFGRNFTGYDIGEVISMNRLKLDSADAVAKVAALPGLKDVVQLTAVEMTLKKLSDGDVPPVWRIKIKGRLKSAPARELWIGQVQLSAETGEVLKNETNVDRLRN